MQCRYSSLLFDKLSLLSTLQLSTAATDVRAGNPLEAVVSRLDRLQEECKADLHLAGYRHRRREGPATPRGASRRSPVSGWSPGRPALPLSSALAWRRWPHREPGQPLWALARSAEHPNV